MRKTRLLVCLAVATAGALLVAGTLMWVSHPYYGLMLISPVYLVACYAGIYGGGAAVIIAAAVAIRELLRR